MVMANEHHFLKQGLLFCEPCSRERIPTDFLPPGLSGAGKAAGVDARTAFYSPLLFMSWLKRRGVSGRNRWRWLP